MSKPDKIFFIVNPAAGTGKKGVEAIIRKGYNTSDIKVHIEFTKAKGDAKLIALKAVKEQYRTIVAVGGDGTVNEIATTLINTGCSLGIIPAGSGNGLARHHHIPMDTVKPLM